MKLILMALVLSYGILAASAKADAGPLDGTYDARVTTDSGTYSVPVEVENGEVTRVEWPNGGRMHMYGADIEGSEATGYNSDGNRIQIEIDGLE